MAQQHNSQKDSTLGSILWSTLINSVDSRLVARHPSQRYCFNMWRSNNQKIGSSLFHGPNHLSNPPSTLFLDGRYYNWSRFCPFLKHKIFINGRQVSNDGLQLHFDTIHQWATFKAIPFDCIKLSNLTFWFDNQTNRPLFTELWRRAHMGRQDISLSLPC